MLKPDDVPPARSEPAPHPGMSFREFVVLIALMMALNALAIDTMLPALDQIGAELGAVGENSQQLVITAYFIGFGIAQLFYGPLSDRFGRKPLLLGGLGLYIAFSLVAAFAQSFDQMLIARALQGIGSASTRVLAVSIVRDCYGGRRMARVMSLAFIVFMAVPVLAPSIGQAIILFAPWQWIFLVLAALAVAVVLWAGIRLPETLPPARRLPLQFGSLLNAARQTLTNRFSLGYTLASTAIFGSLVGFISSAQQVFVEVFDLGAFFPLVFAAIALSIALSSFINSRIVERLGMRLVSHSTMFGFALAGTVHATIALLGYENIVTFFVMQSIMMFFFGLTISNFGALSMDPVGHIAGMASSLQGFISTIGGAVLGYFIGQAYDGSAVPLTLGYAVLGWAAVAIVFTTERGRLFQALNAPARRPT